MPHRIGSSAASHWSPERSSEWARPSFPGQDAPIDTFDTGPRDPEVALFTHDPIDVPTDPPVDVPTGVPFDPPGDVPSTEYGDDLPPPITAS